jgi:hypothetical protein
MSLDLRAPAPIPPTNPKVAFPCYSLFRPSGNSPWPPAKSQRKQYDIEPGVGWSRLIKGVSLIIWLLPGNFLSAPTGDWFRRTASATIQSWKIEVVSRSGITVVISMAWLYPMRSAVGIFLICARSAAGSAGQSLGAKCRFPNRRIPSFERERNPSSGVSMSRFRKGGSRESSICRSALNWSLEPKRGPLVGPQHR